MTEPMAAQQGVRSFEEWWESNCDPSLCYDGEAYGYAEKIWHARDAEVSELREMVRDAQVLLQPVHRYLAGKTRYPGVAYMPVNDWLARATKLLQPQDVKEKK